MPAKIPNSIYDYLLNYECATKDWKSGANWSKRYGLALSNPGSLVECINWSTTSSTTKGDSGGATKCGITHSTWESFFSKFKSQLNGCTSSVDSITKDGWMKFVSWWWKKSGAEKSANNACAIVLYQAMWGGWKGPTQEACLKKLKEVAAKENPSYKISGGDVYTQMASATNAFKNPMDAFQIIRDHHIQYLFNISTPGQKNSQFRVGWMRREVATFQDDGLYFENGGVGGNANMSIAEWKSLCLSKKGKSNGYIKICSWDGMPTNIDAITVDLSSLDTSSGGGSGSGGGGGYNPSASQYTAMFSSTQRNDPHLSAKKDVVLKKGILLGPEFNKK